MISRSVVLSWIIWIVSDTVKETQASYGSAGTSLSANSMASSIGSPSGECRDYSGRSIQHAMHFVPPGGDMCKLCICENGHAKACRAVLCTPPTDCKSFQMGASCCEFNCLDDTLGGSSTSDIAIRLTVTGITATISLTILFIVINRFRQRKSQMRHQNHQNNQDDQRSIGSIGYIGGNIGYMGSMSMEYPYDHPNAHFQLWKPFFGRGEAPPPYEEAITMAQSDTNNPAGCTVSVATSTHRTIPINVCNNNATTENSDLSNLPSTNNNNINNNNNPITSNTTNLINININNAGNITAVATGENHLIQSNGNYLSATPNSTLPRNASSIMHNQIMEHQDLVNRNIAYGSTINNCNGTEMALSSASIREIPCTLQNCDLNTSCSLIRSSSTLSSGGGIVGISAGCYSAPSTMKMNQQNQTSNQSLAQILATNQSTQSLYEQYIDCLNAGAQTILPPPLFDTNNCTTNINQCYEVQSHPGNYCTLSAIDLPKNSHNNMSSGNNNGSKRLHRTIPKHFTMSSQHSPSSTLVVAEVNHQQQQSIAQPHQMTQQQQQHQSHHQQQQHQLTASTSSQQQQQQQHQSSGREKKSSCQCPVQHVPMNYMQYPNQNQANSAQPSSNQPEIQAQFAQQQRHQHSIYMSGSKKHNVIKSTTFPSTINTTTVGAKIQTITTSELMGITNSDVIHQNDMSGSIISSGGSGTLRRRSSSHANNQQSSLAMPTTPNKKSIATISIATSVSSTATSSTQPTYFTPKIDVKHHQQQQQQIHSILKNKNQCSVNVINVVDGANEQNPILPPKLYKTTTTTTTSNAKFSTTPVSGPSSQAAAATATGSSKQIHTITRPSEVTSSGSQFSLLAIGGGSSGGAGNSSSGGGSGSAKYSNQQNYQQPTQLRTNIQGTLYNTKTLPRGSSSSSHSSDYGDRVKSSSSTSHHRGERDHHQQQQSHQVQSTTSNYSTNTLPKNHHQSHASQPIYGKVSNPSRSVLNDVVNKVPSVIMLPLPQQHHVNVKSAPGTPSSSASHDKKCNSGEASNDPDNTSAAVACQSLNSTLKRHKSNKRDILVNANEKIISSKCTGIVSMSCENHEKLSRCGSSGTGKCPSEKPLPVLTTTTNCVNPKEHFLPNEGSLDDDYLSECENCKTAGHGSRYYLNDVELDELPPQETMTLQRKMMNESDENDLQSYYRVSSTLPSSTNKKNSAIKNREPWFSTIPASSSSDEETLAE